MTIDALDILMFEILENAPRPIQSFHYFPDKSGMNPSHMPSQPDYIPDFVKRFLLGQSFFPCGNYSNSSKNLRLFQGLSYLQDAAFILERRRIYVNIQGVLHPKVINLCAGGKLFKNSLKSWQAVRYKCVGWVIFI